MKEWKYYFFYEDCNYDPLYHDKRADHPFYTAEKLTLYDVTVYSLCQLAIKLPQMKCKEVHLKIETWSERAVTSSEPLKRFLLAVTECNITHLSISDYNLTEAAIEVLYNWLRHDNQMVYLGLNHLGLKWQRFWMVVRCHPTLMAVAVTQRGDPDYPILRYPNPLCVRRMVHLLAEPPVPKDILRHIYCFIK
jgi:hypothetical protein